MWDGTVHFGWDGTRQVRGEVVVYPLLVGVLVECSTGR